MKVEIWVAEADNGSVQFDAEPSKSDILNCCDDLELPIRVFSIEAIEISREYLFEVGDEE